MKIWLVNSSEPTPLDEGEVRLLRMGILVKYLLERGHEVFWWNADFCHPTKKHRFGKDKTVEISTGYVVRFLHGPGYRKNISFARLKDHRSIAKKFSIESKQNPKPDVILCSLPTLELSLATVQYGEKNNVPVILDIRDLWPDVIVESFPCWLQPLANLALTPYHVLAKRACRNATAFSGNSPKLVAWGIAKSGRTKNILDQDFPFGYEEPYLSSKEKEEADEFWRTHGIGPESDRPVIAYIGVVGQNFQEDIIVHAAKEVGKYHQALFVFCGGGDRLNELRERYADNQNIILPGLVNAKQLWRLMNHTSIALASYKESGNYRSSLTNKTIEYMAGGLPILFSIDDGYVADLIRNNEIGLTYGGSADRLAESILRLLDNEPYRRKLAENSRRLFERQYKAETVYNNLVTYLEKIAHKNEHH